MHFHLDGESAAASAQPDLCRGQAEAKKEARAYATGLKTAHALNKFSTEPPQRQGSPPALERREPSSPRKSRPGDAAQSRMAVSRHLRSQVAKGHDSLARPHARWRALPCPRRLTHRSPHGRPRQATPGPGRRSPALWASNPAPGRDQRQVAASKSRKTISLICCAQIRSRRPVGCPSPGMNRGWPG